MIYSALPKVLIVLCMAQLIQAQSNGDVRLVKGNLIYPFDGTGRLEIYLDGEWGTFCVNGFNTFAGDAACRQLGYVSSNGKISRASDFVYEIPLASNSTPIHLSNDYNRCSSYSCNGPVHILRCYPEGFDKQPDPSCTHSNDTILSCSLYSLYYDGYDTQLFLNSKALNSTYRSSGVLEIYSIVVKLVNSMDGAIYVVLNLTKTLPTQLVNSWDTLELSPTTLQLIVAVTMAYG